MYYYNESNAGLYRNNKLLTAPTVCVVLQMGMLRVYALLLWLCVLLVTVTGDKSVPLYKKDKTQSSQGPFKNWPLSTARGFGKRAVSDFAPLDSSQFVVRDRCCFLCHYIRHYPRINNRNVLPVGVVRLNAEIAEWPAQSQRSTAPAQRHLVTSKTVRSCQISAILLNLTPDTCHLVNNNFIDRFPRRWSRR